MKNKFTKEVKIGIVTIVGMALLYIGVNYLKGINLFKPVNHYFVTFNNVKDVTVSSPVFVEGFKVGLVRSISYDYSTTDKLAVEISLDRSMRINKDSYVTIEKSLLGGAELHIRLNKYVSEYIPSGSVVQGRMGEDMMQSVQDKILPGVETLLPKIDSILTGLHILINHPALSQSFDHIERTTANLEVSSRQLNSLLVKDVPEIVQSLKTVSQNFSVVSSDIKELDFASTINTVNQTLANLKVMTDRMNSTENTFGALLNDKSLYNNLNSATDNASKLLFDLKENPKRYVHFSIF